jgi:ribosomal protein S27E
MDNEDWVSVAGFEGYYEVSNLGNVRSLTRLINFSYGRTRQKKGVDLKKRENCYGYLMVKMSMYGKEHLKTIHRLVAIAFCPRDKGFDVVNHIDGDRKNNNAANLEWVTSSENAFHTYRTLRHPQVGISHRLAKVTDEKVKECIDLCKNGGITFHEASLKFGVCEDTVNNWVNGLHRLKPYGVDTMTSMTEVRAATHHTKILFSDYVVLQKIKGSNGRSQRLIKCACGHEQLVFVSSWAAHGKIKCRSCMALWKFF